MSLEEAESSNALPFGKQSQHKKQRKWKTTLAAPSAPSRVYRKTSARRRSAAAHVVQQNSAKHAASHHLYHSGNLFHPLYGYNEQDNNNNHHHNHHHYHHHVVVERNLEKSSSGRSLSPRLEQLLRGGNGGSGSTWRLRYFARLVKRSQAPLALAFIYVLIVFTIITPLFFFLHYAGSPDEADRHTGHGALDSEKLDQYWLRNANLVMVIFYGIRNAVLLLLALGVVKQKRVVFALSLDVLVWIANIIVRLFILYHHDSDEHWTSDNIYLLSLAGFLSGLQLNTFMFLNAVLKPMVRWKGAVYYIRTDTVPICCIEDLINEFDISDKHKRVLRDAVHAADAENRGELDAVTWSRFNDVVMVWLEQQWSTGYNSISQEDNDERCKFQTLVDQLQFPKLVERADEEFLKGRRDESQQQQQQQSDQNAQGKEAVIGDNMIDSLVRTIYQLVEDQPLRAIMLVVFVLAMAMTQFFFFKTSGDLLNMAIDMADNDPLVYTQEFKNSILWFFLILCGNISTYYICAYLSSTLIANAKARLQREITLRVLYCGKDFERDFSPGDLGNAFSGSLSKCESLWAELQYNLIFPLCCLFSAVLFFSLVDVGYAMFCLAAIPIIFLVQTVLGPRATEASERGTEATARLMGRFQNAVDVQMASKLYQSQDFLLDRVDAQLAKSRDDNYSSLLWGNVFPSAFNTVASFLVYVMYVTLAFAVATGKINAGEFFSLAYFVNGIVKPIEQLGLFAGRVAFYSGAIQDVESLLSYEFRSMDNDDDDTEKKATPDNDDNHEIPLGIGSSSEQHVEEAKAKGNSIALKKELSFEHVKFQYGPDLPLVLNDVSASVKAGSYSCIFGPSGSGKSTILGLLEGFHLCSKGRICFDGVDIASVPQDELRRILGVVFQQTYILDGSIKENIAFGFDNSNNNNEGNNGGHGNKRQTGRKVEFSMDQIIDAAKDAHIHDFILTLPNQYDTMIGREAEISLSGGQLQRVCGLARAMLRNPQLLILDEATSALDTISEQAVVDTVLKLRQRGITTVSVSHHPNTAQDADRILVLDQGILVQSGNYADLVAEENGIFAALVAAAE